MSPIYKLKNEIAYAAIDHKIKGIDVAIYSPNQCQTFIMRRVTMYITSINV